MHHYDRESALKLSFLSSRVGEIEQMTQAFGNTRGDGRLSFLKLCEVRCVAMRCVVLRCVAWRCVAWCVALRRVAWCWVLGARCRVPGLASWEF